MKYYANKNMNVEKQIENTRTCLRLRDLYFNDLFSFEPTWTRYARDRLVVLRRNCNQSARRRGGTLALEKTHISPRAFPRLKFRRNICNARGSSGDGVFVIRAEKAIRPDDEITRKDFNRERIKRQTHRYAPSFNRCRPPRIPPSHTPARKTLVHNITTCTWTEYRTV